MKKIFAFAGILIFIVSVVAAQQNIDTNAGAEGQKNKSDGSISGLGELGQAAQNLNVSDAANCIAKLSVRFPNADAAKISNACQIVGGLNGRARIVSATTRNYLKEKIAQNAEEWQAKKLDNLIQKRPEVEQFLSSLTEEQQKVFMGLSRSQQQKVANLGVEKAAGLLSNYEIKNISTDSLFKKRVIDADKLRTAAQNFLKAKIQYQNAKENYRESRQTFFETRAQVQKCKDNKTEECIKLNQKVIENARTYALHISDMIGQHLTKLKEKVQASENINETEANETISRIDNALDRLETIKSEINAAETKQQIQKAVSDLQDLWRGIQHRERLYGARLINAQVMEIIKRSEQLEQRLDKTLTKLGDQGYNTSGVQEKVSQFSNYIEDARVKYNQAKEIFTEVKSLDKDNLTDSQIEAINTKIENAKTLLKQAQESLKQAHSLLIEIVKEIKAAGSGIEAPGNETEQVVEVPGFPSADNAIAVVE